MSHYRPIFDTDNPSQNDPGKFIGDFDVAGYGLDFSRSGIRPLGTQHFTSLPTLFENHVELHSKSLVHRRKQHVK